MEETWEFTVMSVGVPRKITSYDTLEKLGRVRLSDHFFMRDFLYSSIGDYYGLANYPENTKLAVEAGSRLCQELLEPIKKKFGHVVIRSAYRSPLVNAKGAENGNQHGCASNEANYARHIWDYRDSDGNMGATACIQVHWFAEQYENGADWKSLAWWIHDHLPYSEMFFFKNRAAFNLNWRENPVRKISSWIETPRILTKPGMDNHDGDHSEQYSWIDEKLQ